jgi:tetratricopeptide (TPR) repeat protein
MIIRRPEIIDPLRVEVARFENRTGDPAFDRLAATATASVFAGLVQSRVVRTVGAASAGVGWRSPLPGEFITPQSQRLRGTAGTVVSGAYQREAGRIRFRMWITDNRRGRRVWHILPVTGQVTTPDTLLEPVRQRVVGGVAVLEDSHYASLLPSMAVPPTFEAYQEFREGLELQSARQHTLALAHFRLAAVLDTNFTWPLVHAALSALRAVQPRGAEVDSILQELNAARERLSPLERHLVTYVRAVRAEDWEGCYRAIREAAAIAPEQFSYTEAIRAMHLQRPRDALSALTRPHLDSIHRSDAKSYWFVLTSLYHQLGEHRRELTTARTARRHAPANASLLNQEIRALAALGRTAAVQARVDTLVTLPRDDWLTPLVALMGVATELRAHGQPGAASEALARAIAWHQSRHPLEASMEVRRYFFAWTLYLAGRLEEADSVFRGLHREHPDNADYIGHLGAIAARRGDRTAARHLSDQLKDREVEAPIPGETSIVWRAQIAALLGEQAEAMRLLIEAFGSQGTVELHGNSDFDGMRNYPPFKEFVRPKG